MRSPGSAEAVFVQELLARRLPTKSFGSAPPMAQRTRYNVKARLYERRILEDRYVPDTVALGRGLVVLAVAEIYADRSGIAQRAWEAMPAAIHIVVAEGWQLGVFVLEAGAPVERLREQLNPSASLRSEMLLACDPHQSTIPAYFDYEGAWARTFALEGLRTYPRSFPSSTFTESATRRSLNPRDRAALGALLRRPFELPSRRGDASWLRRAAMAPREHRLLADGLVEFRSFVNPAESHRWIRGFPPEMVLVMGRFSDRADPERLFSDLVEAGVLPFLFASDGQRALFGYLAEAEDGAEDRDGAPRPGSLVDLSPTLRDIIVLRGRLGSIRTAVNQRFDRLDPERRTPSR